MADQAETPDKHQLSVSEIFKRALSNLEVQANLEWIQDKIRRGEGG